MVNLAREVGVIAGCAFKYGVDPYFVCAIRKQENGPDEKEFGVISTRAVGYGNQLDVTCKSVRNRLAAYRGNPLQRYGVDLKRVAYTRKFIEYFASIWAPIDAPNDHTNLNRFWPDNVCAIYYQLLDDPNDALRYRNA